MRCCFVDRFDHLVGHFLDFSLQPLAIVLADFFLVLVNFQTVICVATHVADRDFGFLSILASELCQFFAAFLGEIGNRQAQSLPIGMSDALGIDDADAAKRLDIKYIC